MCVILGVCEPAECWSQKEDIARRRLRPSDDKWHVVDELTVVYVEAKRIDALLPLLRNRKLGSSFPLGIVEVVVVEPDRAVLIWR